MAFKKYVFDGTKKFVISKTSTNETSLCKDRKLLIFGRMGIIKSPLF